MSKQRYTREQLRGMTGCINLVVDMSEELLRLMDIEDAARSVVDDEDFDHYTAGASRLRDALDADAPVLK